MEAKRLLAFLLASVMLLGSCSSLEENASDDDRNHTEVSGTDSTDNSSSGSNGISEESFGNGGTIISMEDGVYNIEHLTYESETEMSGDDWTVLIYMCGSDLESDYSCATNDVLEMINATYSDNVNIVIQTGGATKWTDDWASADKIQRFEVLEDDIKLVSEAPQANMGDSETLSEFVKWGAENYPAKNMGLVFWNHGGGSIAGVCIDHNYYDSLSLKEIDSALSRSFGSMTERFEFIGFDACLMATLETANMLVPYAKYMYGSQENEPGTGWNYTDFITYLSENPRADGLELGKQICDSYYRTSNSTYGVTLSVTDLSKMDALAISFNETAKQLYEYGNFSETISRIIATESFGSNNRDQGYTNMIDFNGLLSSISYCCPNASDTLNKLDDAVVYKVSGEYHENAGGLSLYYPLAVQGSRELSVFGEICTSAYYIAYVDKAAYGTTGDDPFNYNNEELVGDTDNLWNNDYDYNNYTTNTDEFFTDSLTSFNILDTYFSDDGTYTLKLDSFDTLSFAAMSVFYADEEYDAGLFLGTDDYVEYDWDNNTITDCFYGKWLALDDGQHLPINCVEQTEDYSFFICSILLNGKETYLHIVYDWNTKEWTVRGTLDAIDSETGMSNRDVIPLEKGDIICPIYYYYIGDEEGYLPGDSYVVGNSVEVSYQPLPEGDYYYCMTLYDIYGNWYNSTLVTFTVEPDGSMTFYPEELEDTGSGDSGSGLQYALFDQNDCLSDNEEALLDEIMSDTVSAIDCSLCIIMTDDMNGMTSEEYANYYSDEYFGYSEHIVIVVDCKNYSHYIVWYLPSYDFIYYNENYNRIFNVIDAYISRSSFDVVCYLCDELITLYCE